MIRAGTGRTQRDDPRPGDPTAEVMVVCTANICRSPLMMAMLDREGRRRCGTDAPLVVSSSGVQGLTGEPVAAMSGVEAERRRLDLSEHRARVTDEGMLWRSDLVITMSERQRRMVVRLLPDAAPYTFTLRELARVLGALTRIDDDLALRARVRSVVDLAHAARAHVPRPDGPEDVRDPYGGPPAGYERMAAQLDELVDSVAPQLFGWLPDDHRDAPVGR